MSCCDIMDALTKKTFIDMLGTLHRQEINRVAELTRAIEKVEKDRAFYLAQRLSAEDRMHEIKLWISQCQKD